MRKIAVLLIVSLIAGLFVFPVSLNASKAKNINVLSETKANTVFTNLGLYGAYVWDLAIDPTNNNYIYAAVGYSPNGLYRSANGGQTWSGLPANVDYGSGQEVEINPSNGHVFAICGGTLLKSTNNGATFLEIKNPDKTNPSFSGLLYSNNKLYVGTGGGTMLVSTDEGASFSSSTIATGSSIQSIAAYGDTVYALNYNNKLFRSTNAATSWTELTGLPLSSITRVAVNPNTGHVFILPPTWGGTTYRSNDSGDNWNALHGDTPTSGYITFDNSGGVGRTYIGWKYSDNEGDSWSNVNDRGSYNHLLMPDPTNYNILYDTSSPGFSKSTDRGASFTSSVEGISGVVVTSVSQATDKNIVWAATQNGLAKTTNFLSAAPTWQYPIKPTGDTYISGSHDSVWVHPTNPNIVVTGGSNDLRKTEDGGTTWIQPTTALSFTENLAYQIISNTDASVLYTAVGKNVGTTTNPGGVMTSTNNGSDWNSMNFPANSAQSIALAKDGDIFVGAGSKAKDESTKGIYKYSGGTWTRLSAPNYDFVSIIADPENANTIYALAGSNSGSSSNSANLGFYKSTNDGAKWTRVAVSSSNLYEYNTMAIQKSTTPNTLYLSAVDNMKGVVYKSSDGGESWGLFYSGMKSETFSALLFDGLVAGNDRGLYNVKSRATIGLKGAAKFKRGTKALIKVSLRDATNFKKKNKKKKLVSNYKYLKNRTVTIYKQVKVRVRVKVGKKKKWVTKNVWKSAKRVKIGKGGFGLLSLTLGKNTTIQARWSPTSKSDKEEYAKATSKNLKVKVY